MAALDGSSAGPASEALGSDERALDPPGLTRAGARGAAWQGLSYLLGRGLVLITTVVLARVLTPADFGLVALALIFITYVEVASDLGVAQAIVYLPPGRRRNDAALAISVTSSVLLVAAAMVAAPTVARFFGSPQVTSMFRVLSLTLVLTALGQVPDALLRRDLRFRPRVLAVLARAMGQGVASIVLAVAGFGPWAIVGGYLAGSFLYTATAWAQVDYRPGWGSLRIDRGLVRRVVAYGAPAAANGVILSLVFDVDYLVVGRRLGSEALGYYTLAFRVPEMAIINVFFVLSVVAFPLFARARVEGDRLRRGYLTAVRLQTVYGVATGVGLAVVAPMLVHVLFGSRWDPAIAPLEALALYAAFRSLGIGPVDLFKAMGRPGLALWLSLIRLAAVLGAILLAVRAGITGVAWAQAAVSLILALVMQLTAFRLLDLSPARLARAVLPALACGFGVAVGAGAVRLFTPGPEVARLAVAMVAGGAVGFAGLIAADRSFPGEVVSLVRRSRPSTAPALAPSQVRGEGTVRTGSP